MRTLRPIPVWVLLALAAPGCRTPTPAVQPPAPPPAVAPLVVPVGVAASLEPDYAALPGLDAAVIPASAVAPEPPGFRPLTEEVCRREAASRAPLASLLPTAPPAEGDGCAASGTLAAELRECLAAESRNRAAGQALERFYQLADAQGRGEAARATLPTLDQLRATVRQAKADRLRVPVDGDDLDRQRATLLTLLGQADLGASQLDIDLKRRLGVPARTPERLRPAGLPPVTDAPIDEEAAVQLALETRPDLRFLRALTLGLSPDVLPQARSTLRDAGGLPDTSSDALKQTPGPLPALIRIGRLAQTGREKARDAATLAEVALRRQQLYELTLQRERQAADEVRVAAAGLAAQSKQVALTRWRAEQLTGLIAERKGQGPLAERAAELEAARARADVIAAVMSWHQARVKLLAAQGRL